jgi:hypothetical protein
MQRTAVLLGILAAIGLSAAFAQGRKPALPPGRDAGGMAVALLSTGIDYTEPAIAARLARDGEGELIGWDLIDNDNRPFRASGGSTPLNWGGDGTALARALAASGRRIVPVRVAPDDPISLARAVAFVSRTPARIIVLPMWSASESDWQPFRQAVERFGDVLVVAAAGQRDGGDGRGPLWPAAFGLANVLVIGVPQAPGAPAPDAATAGGGQVDAVVATRPASDRAGDAVGDSRVAALFAADAVAGCAAQLFADLKGAALKAAVIAHAARTTGAGMPAIEPCPETAVGKR